MPASNCRNTAELNPFRISAIEQLEWLPYPDTLESIHSKWRDTDYRAQLCGPHGAGKTTLSEHLANSARAEGIDVLSLFANLQSGRCDFQGWDEQLEQAHQDTIVLLDGFDHASWWQRRRWLSTRSRMLVTTHKINRRLPVLLNMESHSNLLHSIVSRLLGEHDHHLLQPLLGADKGVALLQQSQGNLRDALSLLFDRWQQYQKVELQRC
ncbi:MAG: hypothetical protein AB8B48_09205 [Pseudomonadales bacterium]